MESCSGFEFAVMIDAAMISADSAGHRMNGLSSDGF